MLHNVREAKPNSLARSIDKLPLKDKPMLADRQKHHQLTGCHLEYRPKAMDDEKKEYEGNLCDQHDLMMMIIIIIIIIIT